MIKIDNKCYFDFTEELLPVIVFLHFLTPHHEIEREFLAIYKTYLQKEKQIEFSSPCIISLDFNSILVKYLEKLSKEKGYNLSLDPFAFRKNNYIILNWPIKEPILTR